MNIAHLIGFQFFDGAFVDEYVPPPPPVETAAPRFGGGPFWRKYGYDDAYDEIREQDIEEEERAADEIRGKLAKKRQAQADDAVNAAASAMLRDAPAREVLDQEAAFRRIVKAQSGIRKELKSAIESRKAFRAEVRRKLQLEAKTRKIEALKAQEQDEVAMLTAMFWDFDDED